MKINKLNYEVYILDYIEGNLASDEKKAFEKFKNLHPEIKDEISEYLGAPILEEDKTITFTDKKQHLKKDRRSWLLFALIAVVLLLASAFLTNSFRSIKELPESKINNLLQEEIQMHIPLAEAEVNNSTSQTKVTTAAPRKTNPVLKKEGSSAPVATKIKKKKKKTIEATKLMEIAVAVDQKDKLLPSKKPSAVANSNKNQQIYPKESMSSPMAVLSSLPSSTTPYVVSTTETKLLTETRTMVITVDQKETSDIKNKKWWSVITPQAYKDINIGQAISSVSFKSAAKQLELKVLPKNLISK